MLYIGLVKIDNFDKPTINLKAKQCIFQADQSAILAMPKGFANGVKTLESN